jgi:peptidoglycan/xylan/chitin deacetylase (PgdA/CDA1 family)
MGHVVGRVGVAAALLLAASYLLQVDDTLARPAQPVYAAIRTTATAQADPILTVRAGSGDREYFVSRHAIVPMGSRSLGLPILMYHYIRPLPSIRTDFLGYRLSVAPADFEAQMDWLHAHGYHPVNFNHMRDYFAGTAPLPSKPVVITLDDGYRDLYTAAYPILRAHGFTAVAYIVPNFVGQPAYVTQSQILEMDRDGIEIASHTMSHANLARLSFGSAMYELGQSKRWLEQLVGHPVLDFAYPSGKFTPQTVVAVQQAGYSTAVTEQESIPHTMADRYLWGRVRVGGGESLQEFAANLGPSMPSITISNVEVEPNLNAPQTG